MDVQRGSALATHPGPVLKLAFRHPDNGAVVPHVARELSDGIVRKIKQLMSEKQPRHLMNVSLVVAHLWQYLQMEELSDCLLLIDSRYCQARHLSQQAVALIVIPANR
jgi:hypothetical protein